MLRFVPSSPENPIAPLTVPCTPHQDPVACRDSHIPYRDSKLTRLLQRSLGGNAKTALIATVAPGAASMEESLRTIRFACRATYVANDAVVNDEVVDGGTEPDGCGAEDTGKVHAAAAGAATPVSKLAAALAESAAAIVSRAGGATAPFFNDYVDVPTRAGACVRIGERGGGGGCRTVLRPSCAAWSCR